MNYKQEQQSWTKEKELYSGGVYVSSSRTRKLRTRSGAGFVRRLDVAADGTGLFLRGPLQSGVLQQEMQTEFSRPVQNCW